MTIKKFLLPCACGQPHAVDVSQAGQRITCSCGADLEVPTLRGIKQLQPATQAPAQHARSWTTLQGFLFVSGLSALLLGLGSALLLWLYAAQLPTQKPSLGDPELDHQAIENLSVDETWDLWVMIQQHGLEPWNQPAYLEARRSVTLLRQLTIAALVLAALGLAMAITALRIKPKPLAQGHAL